MDILIFAFLIIVVLILVLLAIRKTGPLLKADGDLVTLLEIIAIIVAIIIILARAGLLHA